MNYYSMLLECLDSSQASSDDNSISFEKNKPVESVKKSKAEKSGNLKSYKRDRDSSSPNHQSFHEEDSKISRKKKKKKYPQIPTDFDSFNKVSDTENSTDANDTFSKFQKKKKKKKKEIIQGSYSEENFISYDEIIESQRVSDFSSEIDIESQPSLKSPKKDKRKKEKIRKLIEEQFLKNEELEINVDNDENRISDIENKRYSFTDIFFSNSKSLPNQTSNINNGVNEVSENKISEQLNNNSDEVKENSTQESNNFTEKLEDNLLDDRFPNGKKNSKSHSKKRDNDENVEKKSISDETYSESINDSSDAKSKKHKKRKSNELSEKKKFKIKIIPTIESEEINTNEQSQNCNSKNTETSLNHPQKDKDENYENLSNIYLKSLSPSFNEGFSECENHSIEVEKSNIVRKIKVEKSNIVRKIKSLKFCPTASDNTDEENYNDLISKDEVKELYEAYLSEIEEVEKSYESFLKNLCIVCDWELPLLHILEQPLTSCPKKEQKQIIENAGVEINKRPYTKKEDDIIKRNWEIFSKIYSISDPSIFFSFRYEMNSKKAKLSLEERVKFVQFLGKELNNRLLYSIYFRFKNIYGHVRKGRFSQFENKIIMSFMSSELAKKTDAFSILGKILKRDRISICKHYREFLLVRTKDSVKICWNLENLEKILKSLINNTGVNKLKQLREIKIKKSQWRAVSRDLKVPVSKIKLQWRYKLYPRLFLKENVDLHEIIITIVNHLYENRIKDWKAINWVYFSSLYPGSTCAWIRRIFKWFLGKKFGDDQKTLKEYVISLRKQIANSDFKLKFDSSEVVLAKKLKFKNGKLFEIGSP